METKDHSWPRQMLQDALEAVLRLFQADRSLGGLVVALLLRVPPNEQEVVVLHDLHAVQTGKVLWRVLCLLDALEQCAD